MGLVRRLTTASALLALLSCASTASATFPGRNGEIVMSSWPYPAESGVFANTLTFVHPRTGAVRRVGLCPADSPSPNSGCAGAGAAAVAPDGQRIAFVMSARPTANHFPTAYALSVLPFGGGPAVKQELAHRPQDPAYPAYYGLAWSPDASRLVIYGFEDDGAHQLSFVRMDGRLTGRIIKNAAAPDWSVDGRIVFSRHANPYSDDGNLFVGKPSGRFRRLTREGGILPSWSPDGRRIAFVRNGGVYVISSRGGAARRVIKPGRMVDTFNGPPTRSHLWTRPVWSPDGKQIVATRDFYRRQDSELYALNLKTKKPRRLYGGIQPDDQVFSLDWQSLPKRHLGR